MALALEKQTSWRGLIALGTFLVGTGTGTFTVGFILELTGGMKEMVITAITLGPILAIIGLLCLLTAAGSPTKSYRLLGRLSTSWTSRGALMQGLFIVLGLAYAIPSFWLAHWPDSGPAIVLGSIVLILALAIATYHGIILSEARAIPLWSSSAQPILALFISLCTGLGLVLLVFPAYAGPNGNTEVIKTINILRVLGMAFIGGQLVSIWSMASLRPSATYAGSIARLKKPIITNVVGLFLALFLLGLSFATSKEASPMWLIPTPGALLLVAGFIMRYSILKAGYRLPLRI